MREPRQFSTWMAVTTAVAAALYVLHTRTQYGWLPANDLYTYFYPKVLYALASLRDGGRGLLWNPYQNCGQPFFGISQTGLLYPPYLFFLVFDPERALRAVLFVQLVIGGVGAFLLGRELGARPLAAVAGALAFEVGNSMVALSISSPTHSAPFAWLPVILFCCERLLHQPTLRRTCLLAVAIAVAILPGMPQTVLFTYQLIALRLVFELVTRRIDRPARVVISVGIGLLLPVLLAAVQLFPDAESARASLRGTTLDRAEMNPQGTWGIQQLLNDRKSRRTSQPFLLVPCAIGLAGLFAAKTRRVAVFYAGAAALSVALACGPGTLLFDLYARLPAVGAFRMSSRFLWMTSFCLAPLTALGVEGLASQSALPTGWRSTAVMSAMVLPLGALWWLTPGGFTNAEWSAALLVIGVGFLIFIVRGTVRWASAVLVLALAIELVLGGSLSPAYLLPTAPDFFAADALFAAVRKIMGPQDRIYLLHGSDHRFMSKSASLYRLPAVLDYEPLASQRYANLSCVLRSGRPMRSLNDFLYRGPQLAPTFSRPLLDLTAARYLIATPPYVPSVSSIQPPLRMVETIDELTIFENPQSLPRAFFVPRIEVVGDAQVLLERLANGADDLRQIALVEEEPASGFLGTTNPAGTATVRFARNDPEDVALELAAPERGFLVLSDQDYPGWYATLDGRPVPVQRANYAFRLVEVPAGRSIVEFRYSPRSLWLGAWVSAVSAAAVASMLLRSYRHSVPNRRGT